MSDKELKDGAIRLFESLSGVDEKYLIACEKDKASGSKILRFTQKYGMGMAAVICMAVLGTAYIGLNQDKSCSDMHNSLLATEKRLQADTAMEAAEEELAPEGIVTEAPAMAEDGVNGEEMEGNSITGAASGSSVTSDVLEKVDREDFGIQQDLAASVEKTWKLTLEEAGELAVVGAYVPEYWPEGGKVTEVYCVIKEADTTVEERNPLMLRFAYENNWDEFFVRVSDLGSECPEWVKEEMKQGICVEAEAFTKEYVEQQIKAPVQDSKDTDMPRGLFGILYQEDGRYIHVYFNGKGNADEIWKMLKR